MRANDLSSLRKDAVPEPPRTLDSGSLIHDASRRQARRRTTISIPAAAAVVVAAAVLFWPRADLAAVPAAGPTSGTPGSSDASGSGASTGCPRLRPGTDDASADYIDLLVWQGETYVRTASPSQNTTVGEQVTTVGCSITELTKGNHNLVEPTPWPNRTATFLPSKTPIYAIVGVPSRCALAVEQDRDVSIYTAVDMNDPNQKPICPARG